MRLKKNIPMKKKQFVSVFIAFVMVLAGCKDSEMGPLATNGDKPGVITNVRVENMAGGAKITYTLPSDEDVLYVLAEYPSTAGGTRITKASSYTNYVVLDGFADVQPREVTLYVVNRSENRSESVTVTIQPLKANLHSVFESLEVRETFGGVNATFTNEQEDEYIFYTMTKDEGGSWIPYDRLYTNSKNRDYSVRGLASEPTDFAFFFTDKWQNSSDTLFASLTPLFETQLDKALWKHHPLPGDTYIPEFDSWRIQNLWDGTTANIFYVKPNLEGLVLPNWFTIDLGQEAKFSRIRVNQLSHHDDWMFSSGAPRVFEIYGSNDPPSDGSWNNWTLLSTYESQKPSGSPLGSLTNEDRAVAIAGEDFTFPIDIDSYRYIRFKTNRTYGGNTNVMISELTFWGQPMN